MIRTDRMHEWAPTLMHPLEDRRYPRMFVNPAAAVAEPGAVLDDEQIEAAHNQAQCVTGVCRQGRGLCPTPQACQVPEPDTWPRVPRITWRGLTPAGRFWLGYLCGMNTLAAVLLGVHLFARF